MEFIYHPKFKKDYKKLFKKFRSLDEDLEKFKKVLIKFPRGLGGKHWPELHRSEGFFVIKTRLSCRYLKKGSLRIIYAYHKKTEEIESIEFIELYFKGNKGREDLERIKEYIKKNQ